MRHAHTLHLPDTTARLIESSAPQNNPFQRLRRRSHVPNLPLGPPKSIRRQNSTLEFSISNALRSQPANVGSERTMVKGAAELSQNLWAKLAKRQSAYGYSSEASSDSHLPVHISKFSLQSNVGDENPTKTSRNDCIPAYRPKSFPASNVVEAASNIAFGSSSSGRGCDKRRRGTDTLEERFARFDIQADSKSGQEDYVSDISVPERRMSRLSSVHAEQSASASRSFLNQKEVGPDTEKQNQRNEHDGENASMQKQGYGLNKRQRNLLARMSSTNTSDSVSRPRQQRKWVKDSLEVDDSKTTGGERHLLARMGSKIGGDDFAKDSGLSVENDESLVNEGQHILLSQRLDQYYPDVSNKGIKEGKWSASALTKLDSWSLPDRRMNLQQRNDLNFIGSNTSQQINASKAVEFTEALQSEKAGTVSGKGRFEDRIPSQQFEKHHYKGSSRFTLTGEDESPGADRLHSGSQITCTRFDEPGNQADQVTYLSLPFKNWTLQVLGLLSQF